jgi:hypothetical protein
MSFHPNAQLACALANFMREARTGLGGKTTDGVVGAVALTIRPGFMSLTRYFRVPNLPALMRVWQ